MGDSTGDWRQLKCPGFIDVYVNVNYELKILMNHLEQQLTYPLDHTVPPAGRAIEVAPGVKWIRMSLPFALDHINLWLLRDEIDGRQGWSVVDCCISRDETKAQWESVFTNELEGLPILRVIVTHMHPDHIGLAHWLCERWSGEPGAEPPQAGGSPIEGQRPAQQRSVGACSLWISATDYGAARMASQSTTGFGGENAARFFAAHGLTDPEAQEKIRARASYYPGMVPAVPPSYRRMMDGDLVTIGTGANRREWRCISGHGHAPEHIALYSAQARVLISGDMVLPRISTNVSVYDIEPESNPLKLFLVSLEKYRALDADTLVLPSHGRPFQGLHTRLDQLAQHHRERLDEVLQACQQGPRSAADILAVLFKRKLDLHQTTFAMGESVAHLHALWFDGQLVRTRDADGVYRFGAQR